MFVALNFVTLLDLNGQDFILKTVMRSYSRRLNFLELNLYVDLRRIKKIDYSSHIITTEKQSRVPQNKIMTQ